MTYNVFGGMLKLVQLFAQLVLTQKHMKKIKYESLSKFNYAVILLVKVSRLLKWEVFNSVFCGLNCSETLLAL